MKLRQYRSIFLEFCFTVVFSLESVQALPAKLATLASTQTHFRILKSIFTPTLALQVTSVSNVTTNCNNQANQSLW